MLSDSLNTFKAFREDIFQPFAFRADATMALLDVLSGNTTARRVIELSLHPAFSRR
jgi:hypothetical protein